MESLAAIYITKLLDTTKPATSSLKFSMFCTIQRIENEITDWNLKLKAAGFVETMGRSGLPEKDLVPFQHLVASSVLVDNAKARLSSALIRHALAV